MDLEMINLKFIQKAKDPRKAKTILKNKMEALTVPDTKVLF